jgi:hypothetical protein
VDLPELPLEVVERPLGQLESVGDLGRLPLVGENGEKRRRVLAGGAVGDEDSHAE